MSCSGWVRLLAGLFIKWAVRVSLSDTVNTSELRDGDVEAGSQSAAAHRPKDDSPSTIYTASTEIVARTDSATSTMAAANETYPPGGTISCMPVRPFHHVCVFPRPTITCFFGMWVARGAATGF